MRSAMPSRCRMYESAVTLVETSIAMTMASAAYARPHARCRRSTACGQSARTPRTISEKRIAAPFPALTARHCLADRADMRHLLPALLQRYKRRRQPMGDEMKRTISACAGLVLATLAVGALSRDKTRGRKGAAGMLRADFSRRGFRCGRWRPAGRVLPLPLWFVSTARQCQRRPADGLFRARRRQEAQRRARKPAGLGRDLCGKEAAAKAKRGRDVAVHGSTVQGCSRARRQRAFGAALWAGRLNMAFLQRRQLLSSTCSRHASSSLSGCM